MKYNIEGDFDFYDELYKTLDDNDNANDGIGDNICLITQEPLTDNFVTLDCKHRFNYDALYKEIYNQKCKFKTYDCRALSHYLQNKMKGLGIYYFIRCPYCRNVQFNLLPDLNSEIYPKVYGINTNDIAYTQVIDNQPSTGVMLGGFFYDTTKINKCEYDGCMDTTCAFNQQFKVFVCYKHMKMIIKTKTQEQKLAIKLQNAKLKEEAKVKLKEEKLKLKQEKMKLKQEKKSENKVIASNGIIDTYVPEHILCSAILKTGINKGSQCGAKALTDGLCKRHCPKSVPTSDVGNTKKDASKE